MKVFYFFLLGALSKTIKKKMFWHVFEKKKNSGVFRGGSFGGKHEFWPFKNFSCKDWRQIIYGSFAAICNSLLRIVWHQTRRWQKIWWRAGWSRRVQIYRGYVITADSCKNRRQIIYGSFVAICSSLGRIDWAPSRRLQQIWWRDKRSRYGQKKNFFFFFHSGGSPARNGDK